MRYDNTIRVAAPSPASAALRALRPVLVLALLSSACATPPREIPAPEPEPLRRIAFGSCTDEDQPQPLWDAIVANRPGLWIWLGDNVYADTEDMGVMAAKYAVQGAHPGYRRLLESTPVVGIWDDHDYGANNGGKEYPRKRESQRLLLDFLGEPPHSPRRTREGVYASYSYGPVGKEVKVILLDTRYHRDPLGSDGALLGEEQWRWLESELRGSRARVHLIGSGIQVLQEDLRGEKWANFPRERERLLRLIAETRVPGVVLLSGDVHMAEVMRLDDPRIGYPLWEVTSSGMTHTWDDPGAQVPNRHRVGPMLVALNFGVLEIDWESAPVRIRLQVRDPENRVRLEQTLSLDDLRPRG